MRIEIKTKYTSEDECYGFFCNECGNEVLVKTLFANEKIISECPCCGAKLFIKKGYYFEYRHVDVSMMFRPKNPYAVPAKIRTIFKPAFGTPGIPKFESGVDWAFEDLEKERYLIEKEQFEKKLDMCQTKCDIPAQNVASFEKVNMIKNDPAKLKEYILNLVTLENNIYSIAQRLMTLYPVQLEANRKSQSYFYEFTQKILNAEQYYKKCCEKVKQYESGKVGLKRPKKPTPPIMITPGLLNKKRILAENQAKEEQYQADLLVYEKQVSLYEEEKTRLIIEARNEADRAKNVVENVIAEKNTALQDTNTPASIAVKMVEKEIEDAESMMKSLYECRNTLYGFDVIYGKYRNAVALSTFYEYLMAGRCLELEGTNGAYNIYENELRANLIIEKLDEIKETQHLIHSSLKKINSNLDYLNTTMSTALESIQHMEKDIAHISENSDVIAHNSAVTAYYSKMNAELINSLGYLVAFK